MSRPTSWAEKKENTTAASILENCLPVCACVSDNEKHLCQFDHLQSFFDIVFDLILHTPSRAESSGYSARPNHDQHIRKSAPKSTVESQETTKNWSKWLLNSHSFSAKLFLRHFFDKNPLVERRHLSPVIDCFFQVNNREGKPSKMIPKVSDIGVFVLSEICLG